MNIFNNSVSSLYSDGSTDRLLVASVTINIGGKAVTDTLPVLAISEMSHQNRQQIDSSLDGTVHVLSAAGGLGTCQITFMDRLKNCESKPDATAISALHQYSAYRKSLSGSNVVVKLLGADGKTSLAKFTGVIKTCTATAHNKGGVDTLLVTYIMQGVMDNG
jgi:hypothetical protein